MKLGFISITRTAMPPLMALAQQREGLEYLNYLDEGIEMLEAERGGVDDDLLARMTGLLRTARDDGAEGLLITCSMFTPYLDKLRSGIKVPVIAADEAMMKLAVKDSDKLLLLCTNPGTVEPSESLLRRCAEEAGRDPEIETVLLEEAWTAVHEGDNDKHNRLIREAIRDHEDNCDVIVLAQMSMAAAVLDFESKTRVMTSPGAALDTLEAMLR